MKYEIKFRAVFILDEARMPEDKLKEKLESLPYEIETAIEPSLFANGKKMVTLSGTGRRLYGPLPSEPEACAAVRKDLGDIVEDAIVDAAARQVPETVHAFIRAKAADGPFVEIPLEEVLAKAFPDLEGYRINEIVFGVENGDGERLEAALSLDPAFPGIAVDGFRKKEKGEDLFWLCSAELPNEAQPNFTARIYAGHSETESDSPIALVAAAPREEGDKSKKAVFVDLDEADCWYMHQCDLDAGFPSTSGEYRKRKKAGR